MFEKLQERLDVVFKKVKGYGKLSESNIKDSLREVRVALLEADVNYKVAKDFLEKVQGEGPGGRGDDEHHPGPEVREDRLRRDGRPSRARRTSPSIRPALLLFR